MGKKNERIAELEAEVSALKRDMELLKAAISKPVHIPTAGPHPDLYGRAILPPSWGGTSGYPKITDEMIDACEQEMFGKVSGD